MGEHASINPPTEPATRSPLPSRRARRVRWALRACLWPLLFLVVVIAALTQGPIPKAILASLIRRQTGAEFRSGWVSLWFDGALEVHRPRLRVPGVAGPEGQFAAADSLRVHLGDLTSATLADLWRRVELQGVRLRISQHRATDRLNIEPLLRSDQPASAEALPRLPALFIGEAIIELGEHGASQAETSDPGYVLLADVRASASVIPSRTSPSRSLLRINQLDPLPADADLSVARPLQLSGWFDSATGTAELSATEVDLARLWPEQLPQGVRDLWRTLRMRGQIARTTLRYARGTGVVVDLHLDRVALQLPITAGRPEITGTARRPRANDVAGVISFTPSGIEATLRGVFESIPNCQITLRTEGYAPWAPYRATISTRDVTLDSDPRVLWFAPEVVRTNLERFSGPTASIDTEINVRRGPPVQGVVPNPLISGLLTLRDGVASFAPFPYPISDIRGAIRFDDQQVRIISLAGRGPTGASLSAAGLFEPLSDLAAVDLRVEIVDVPIDANLERALRASGSASLIDLLFSKRRYQDLLDAGVVLSPESAAALERQRLELSVPDPAQPDDQARRQELARVEAALARPVFRLGGSIDRVAIHVTRQFGFETGYTNRIDAVFENAGLVPEVFPYPITARDLLLTIQGRAVRVHGERCLPIQGGSATIDIVASLPEPGGTSPPPEVRIAAERVPIGEGLLYALGRVAKEAQADRQSAQDQPEPAQGSPTAALSLAAEPLLRALRPQGTVSAVAHFAPKPPDRPDGPHRIGYGVSVTLDGLAANFGTSPDVPLAVQGLSGTLSITDTDLRVHELAGTLYAPQIQSAQASPDAFGPLAPLMAGRFVLRGSNTFGSAALGVPGRVSATLLATELDLAAPLESLFDLFSDRAGNVVSDLRGRADPRGVVDLAVTLRATTAPAPDRVQADITLLKADNVSLNTLGGRLAAHAFAGSAGATLLRQPGHELAPTRAWFDGARAAVSYDGAHAGTLRLDGTLQLRPVPGAAEAPAILSGAISQGVLENPLYAGLLASGPEPTLADTLRAYDARALFDADFSLNSGDPLAPSISGAFRPEAASFVLRGKTVAFPIISGQVRFQDNRGSVESLVAQGNSWETTINGAWAVDPAGGGLTLDLTADADAAGLVPDLLAVLPEQVQGALEQTQTAAPRGLSFRNVSLSLRAPPREEPTYVLRGDAVFRGLSTRIGTPLRDADGAISIDVRRLAQGRAPDVNLGLHADSLVVGAVTITDAHGLVSSTPDRPGLRLEWLSGRAAGGRLAAVGSVEPVPPGDSRYSLTLHLAGARFADLLADVGRAAPATQPPPAGPQDAPAPRRMQLDTAAAPSFPGDTSRGTLDAEFSLTGLVAQPDSAHGRLSLRIAGGDVVRLPLTVAILKLGTFQLPTDERLDFFRASAFIQGDHAEFDELVLLSDSVSLVGWGGLSLGDLALDLHFNGRGGPRIPLLSQVMDLFRDELVTVRLRGSLSDPRVGGEILAGTRRFLSVVTRQPTPGPRTLADAEQRARDERLRLRRRAASDGAPAPSDPLSLSVGE